MSLAFQHTLVVDVRRFLDVEVVQQRRVVDFEQLADAVAVAVCLYDHDIRDKR